MSRRAVGLDGRHSAARPGRRGPAWRPTVCRVTWQRRRGSAVVSSGEHALCFSSRGKRMGHVNPRHKACFGGRARREPGCPGTNQRAACICGLGWPAAQAVARYGYGFGCVLHLAARSALERSPIAGCVQSLPRWRATWRPSAGCGRHG